MSETITSAHQIDRLNIRVYGILKDENNRVLVSDEFIRGAYVTKFPGGGLEFGEGTRDCLKREFLEETGLDVTITDHLYTTDFFQMSAFKKTDQIISIYYLVTATDHATLATKNRLFDFHSAQIADPNGQCEVFRWIEWNELSEESLSLPIDKIVVKLLKEKY
jgi:ADP-ribose pyrophosphatase YjhB (NUDIX family)